MRREFITDEELLEAIREHGFEKFNDVKIAHLEADGKISVIGNARRPVNNQSEPKN